MRYLNWILVVGLGVLIAGCGYRFEGGGYVNKTIQRVAVKPFENQSSETGAGVVFTSALIREILEKTDSRVVDETNADAVFHGQVESVTFHTLARASTESVVERQVRAVVDLKLVDSQGNILWAVKDFAADEEYTVSADTVTDESNKGTAVEKIANRIAEKLVSKTQVNF